MVGRRLGGRAGWDALLAPVRGGGGERGQRGGLQRDDVAGVADHHPGPVGGQPVTGDHRGQPAGARAAGRAGGDVDAHGAEAVGHGHRRAGQLRRHRIGVAAVGDQRLRRDLPLGGEHRGERRRQRGEPLGRRVGEHAAPSPAQGAQPGVAAGRAERIQRGLRGLGRDVVAQGAPPALGGGVVGLLHHALAVAPPRRADRHGDAVVLGDRGERRGHLPRTGVADRRHPVEPPAAGQPTQFGADPVQGVDQDRLFHAPAEHPAPSAGVRQRADQQECPASVACGGPGGGRVGQLDPVELGLFPGRVVDHRGRTSLRRGARFTRRAQAPGPQLAGERGVRPVVTEVDDLVEQGHRPQVRVLGQPGPAVVAERGELIWAGRRADPGLAAVQVGADGLAVATQVPSDRRDRPALAT